MTYETLFKVALCGFILSFFTFTSACKKKGQTDSKGDRGTILAHIGERVITIKDFEQALQNQSPYFRSQYGTLKRKKEFLETLIQFEILILEAQKRGFQKLPEVRQAKNRAMVQQMIKRITKKVQPLAISKQELLVHYRKNYKNFHQPARRRVRQIAVFYAKDASDAKKQKQEASFAKLYPKIKLFNQKKNGFIRMVRAHSKDPLKAKSDGDQGYQARTEKGGKWSKVLSDAAFSLKKVGDITPILKTPRGLHILRLEEIILPVKQSFEQVQSIIRQRLLTQRRTQAYRKFLDSLRKKHKVQIDQKQFEQVKQSLKQKVKAP